MERKIGEIFEFNGEWYQCVGGTCRNCSFYYDTVCKNITTIGSTNFGNCHCSLRTDHKSVIFKKLEKVGKPVTVKGRTFRKLTSYNNSCKECVFNVPNKACCKNSYIEGICDDNGFWVEIKQTKEDMEEKAIKIKTEDIKVGNKVICLSNSKPYVITEVNCRMKYNGEWNDCVIYTPLYDNPYKCFVRPIKDFAQNFMLDNEKEEKHSNLESTGKNLKPFDLEKANAGKPVCTRDGRKARIICFDRRLFYKNVSYPILALVERPDGEDDVCAYNGKGKVIIEDDSEFKDDLMMIPEKKEGWVNVYRDCDGANITKDDNIYSSKEAAMASAQIIDRDNYVATAIIKWEE